MEVFEVVMAMLVGGAAVAAPARRLPGELGMAR